MLECGRRWLGGLGRREEGDDCRSADDKPETTVATTRQPGCDRTSSPPREMADERKREAGVIRAREAVAAELRAGEGEGDHRAGVRPRPVEPGVDIYSSGGVSSFGEAAQLAEIARRTEAYAKRAFPVALGPAIEGRVCLATHWPPGRTTSGLGVLEQSHIWGHNLFKFAPVLGELLAGLAGDSDIPDIFGAG